MSDIIAALKDAGPALTIVALVMSIGAVVYLFKRLDKVTQKQAAALEEMVTRMTERLGMVGERVAILENNDKTRQHSLSDGSARFAQLEAADRSMQDRYLKISAACITKEDCARCSEGQAQKLDGLISWMERVEQHLTANDQRWMDLSQRIDARFEPLTRMLSEMVARAGGEP